MTMPSLPSEKYEAMSSMLASASGGKKGLFDKS
jgi:hypothetical protein